MLKNLNDRMHSNQNNTIMFVEDVVKENNYMK